MKKAGETSNFNNRDDDDDDDDRKPPAKEIVVRSNGDGGKRREEPQEDQQEQQQNNNNVNSPRSTEDTADETTSVISSSGVSYAASPASTAAAASPQTPAAASPSPLPRPPSSVMTTSKPMRRLWQDERPGTTTTSTTATSIMMQILQSLPSWSPQQQLALVLLLSTTIMSMTAFICFILPLSAIFAMVIGTTSFGLLLQQAYFYLLQDLNNRIENGHGLSELLATYNILPQSLMQTLTRTTLHEYMTDNSLVLEYRYLMLYFVPGLSTEQLNAYIDRLAPRHVEMLRRPGLGQFFGPNFMRALIGRQAWEQLQQQQQQQQQALQQHGQQQQQQASPSLLPAPSSSSSSSSSPPPHQIQLLQMQDRAAMDNAVPANNPDLFEQNYNRDDDDNSQSSCSDLGLAITTNDMAGGLSESQATRMARQLGLISSPPPPPTTTAATTTPTAVPLTTTTPFQSPNNATTAPVLQVPAVTNTVTAAAAAITTTTTSTGARDPTPEEAAEGNVLQEAYWSSYNYYYSTAMDTVRRAIVPSSLRAGTVMTRVGVIGAIISIPVAGIGAAAFWTDAFSSSFSFLSRFWSRTMASGGNSTSGSRSNVLWTSVVLGGGVATAGVVLYATTSATRSTSSTTTTAPSDKKNEQKNDKDEDDDKTKK